LAAGATAANNTFGELGGTVTGTVFIDLNNDGIRQAGESGIGSVTITLTGTDTTGAAVSLTTTTAADGSYSFTGLRASNASGYTLTETQPTGYADGLDAKNGVVIAGSNTTDVISGVVIAAAATAANNTFGELGGTVNGTVFVDLNNDGLRQAGENGIATVTITLTGTDTTGAAVSLTTTTAADGSYSFSGLRASNAAGYTLTETQPAGYADGLDAKNAVVIAGSNTTDVISGIVLNAGATAATNTFGELGGTASGSVFVDLNNDGLRQAGENGIGSVTITLTGTDTAGAAVNLSTTTAADGSYSFTGLRASNAGGYTITESQPAAYADGFDAKNGVVIPGSNTTDVISGVVLTSG